MNKRNGLASNSWSKSGFSLVEVAVALGITGFALIAILGLLIANVQTGMGAKEETVTADMVQDVLGDLKTQKTFAALQSHLGPSAYTYYFDADGNLLSPANPNAVPTGAFYMCATDLKVAVPPASGVAAPWPSNTPRPPLITVTMTFSWPAAHPTQSVVLNATLAQF